MTTIQIRIDEKTKNTAKKVLDELGLDMSAAIKMYLKQIAIRNGIPLQLLTENGLILEQERNILKASEEAKKGKNVTKPLSHKEALEYLD